MSVPPVTRAWLTAAVVSTLGTRFGLFNIMLLAFNPSLIWNNFQVCLLPRRSMLPFVFLTYFASFCRSGALSEISYSSESQASTG